ncbi:DsbG Protein-disulfide isomerase [Candidatus Planktophila versatilis]|uniref:DsbA family protein n=1 Tax=Candidatus Planktophila versatilis TaxID=1884905 RepID=UPI003BEEBBCC
MSAKPQPGKDNFTRNLVIGVVLGVVLIMLVPTIISKQTKLAAKIPASVSAERGYGVVFNGELTGVPVIDVYEDFQCPVCAQFEGAQGQYLESLIADKKATVVFHTLSFIGTESILAANAAACSADEDKFLALHKMLYQTQPKENSGAWTNEALVAAGGSVGIKSKAYKDCVTNGTYADWVTNVQAAAAKQDVNSTPTVFINGKELERGNNYYDRALFKAAVERG